MLVRLMPESRSLGKARHEGRCGASVKWRNAADALLSGTRRAGLILPLTVLACACGGLHCCTQSAWSAKESAPVK
ncbi:hypothetical protein [Roseibium album]|uniref:hypothetical protein n=1 Tax=Roseibium album TaxID=311410 RepID=UPI0006D77E84|nr:hypothetical protein [Roseibium album]